MKITFINPAIGKRKDGSYISTKHLEPLSLAVLAGLTPEDIEVELIDDRFEDIAYDHPTDLVAITVETHTALRAYQIASGFRKMGVPVVLGGFHPSLMPEEAAQYTDAVVIGEAEQIWGEVITDAKKRKLRKIYYASQKPNLSGLFPNRKIYKGKKYLPIALVETGRGCNFSCSFCSISKMFKQSYKVRPIQDVLAEIETLKTKYILFVDDNLIVNPERAKELFKALIPLKICWAGQVRVDSVDDEKMLQLMAKSGCACLLIGFESLNKDNLRGMNKYYNISTNYERVLSKIRNSGIMVDASFVFGYDHDTPDTFDKTLEFTMKQKIALAYFNHLRPYPGTSIYAMLLKQNRLLYKKWWIDSTYHFGDAAFIPVHMTAKQLVEKCEEIKKIFYSNFSIIKRGLDFKANCKNLPRAFLYLFMNMINRKEIAEKRTLKFGSEEDNEPILF